MTQLICSVKNVSFGYKENAKQLEGINFVLRQGEALAVLGASGSGKSTLARLLAGFHSPAHGSIEFHTAINSPLDTFRLRQMVFQDPSSALTPFYTPYKTIQEVLKLHDKDSLKQRESQIETLLLEVGLKKDLFHKKISKLSGGEKQRLLIARCLSVKPRLLILDEPLSSSDPLLQKEILDILKHKMRHEGLSILIILHDIHQACYIAQKILLLKEGRQEVLDTSFDFINSPKTPYAQTFLEAFY